MELTSVNRALPEQVLLGREAYFTAIVKHPVEGPVGLDRSGLDGDGVGSPQHHGGPDQAVYVYGSIDADWWSTELRRPLDPGTFGENLTVAGLASADLAIGDRLRIGDAVVVEVTAPRIPCGTLAARMDDGRFVKRFREARRPGAYARVIQPGVVVAGDTVALAPAPARTVPLLEMFDLAYRRDIDSATLRRLLEAPIAERARRAYERMEARSR